MKLSSRFSALPAVAAGAMLGGVLFAGLSHRAQGQDATTVATPAEKGVTPTYLRVRLDDAFTQELRLAGDAPVRVATRVGDIDYVIAAEPHRQEDGSSLVMLSIKKTVRGMVAGKPSAAEQSTQTSQRLIPDGPERQIAGFRSTTSSKPEQLTKTTVSLHTTSLF